MKITKIEQNGNVFVVTKSPNLLQRIFGLKTKVYKYKATGDIYRHFGNVPATIPPKRASVGV